MTSKYGGRTESARLIDDLSSINEPRPSDRGGRSSLMSGLYDDGMVPTQVKLVWASCLTLICYCPWIIVILVFVAIPVESLDCHSVLPFLLIGLSVLIFIASCLFFSVCRRGFHRRETKPDRCFSVIHILLQFVILAFCGIIVVVYSIGRHDDRYTCDARTNWVAFSAVVFWPIVACGCIYETCSNLFDD